MNIGNSLFDEEGAKFVPKIMNKAEEKNVKIIFPEHLYVVIILQIMQINLFDIKNGIDDGYMGLDIGIKSIMKFEEYLDKSKQYYGMDQLVFLNLKIFQLEVKY